MLNLRNNGYSTRKRLRGVPTEIFGNGLTPPSLHAFRQFSRILGQYGGMIVRAGQDPPPISNLQPSRGKPLLARKARPATRKKLIALLGEDEGLQVWAARPQAATARV